MPTRLKFALLVVGTPLLLAAASIDSARAGQAAGSGSTPVVRADLTFIAAADYTACAQPPDPGAPPDGTSATRAQMIAAQKTMKAYDAATTAYTHCIDQATRMVLSYYRAVASADEVRAVNQLGVKLHNGAVDRDQKLVDRFNVQLRTFLARQRPGRSYQNPLPPAS